MYSECLHLWMDVSICYNYIIHSFQIVGAEGVGKHQLAKSLIQHEAPFALHV